MATIKSYTDVEQSKKLAEILPLESADMWWIALNWQETEYYVEVKQDGTNQPKKAIPCWSLASLLELLPKRLETVDNVYELNIYFYGLYYWDVNKGNLLFESKDKDNLVDACYELILKLHELKML